MLRSGGAWIPKSVCGVGPSMETMKASRWLNQKEEYDCKDFRLNSY